MRAACARSREIGVDSSLIRLFERAFGSLHGRDALLDTEDFVMRVMYRKSMRRALEDLLVVARDAVGTPGARYYDCGVMLCRVLVCAAITREDSSTPTGAPQGSDRVARYRAELVRACEVLVAFITHPNHALWRDPGQRALDRRLDDLAAYLATWRAAGANLDDDFLGQVEGVTRAAGVLDRVVSGHPPPNAAPTRNAITDQT
ncbi:hypothetical protein [Saccharothrix variisporea]|uniref:hypothetical protein n=1 Tax=Saccharothrix variisporea TaxID=543527 RepID=UPI0011C4A7A8|nr:hypothetical protein [Saccharothrix variisporea]